MGFAPIMTTMDPIVSRWSQICFTNLKICSLFLDAKSVPIVARWESSWPRWSAFCANMIFSSFSGIFLVFLTSYSSSLTFWDFAYFWPKKF
ncbi:hypothetical protein QL285_070835 [Trifolium repens]|nr:hypothetical protein QL285_070835 [Trifolium repens]